MTYYILTTLALAVALYFPVSNLVHVVSVRRLQRKTGTELGEAAVQGQKQRARFIAILVALLFAAMFNYNVFGIPT